MRLMRKITFPCMISYNDKIGMANMFDLTMHTHIDSLKAPIKPM